MTPHKAGCRVAKRAAMGRNRQVGEVEGRQSISLEELRFGAGKRVSLINNW